ncbi:MAG: peptide-methionine (S)-S-oxide reductase MsrA [Geminicoccaceae bacterium]
MRRILLAAATAVALAAPALADPPQPGPGEDVAVFATGCFWCTESDFEKVPGVIEVVSGYTGGTVDNPTYHQVGAGGTGHAEAVKVRFDPARVTYAQLLDKFWHTTDLLDGGGQFCDRGDQYRSEIFYIGDEQKRLAEESKAAIEASGRFGQPIATRIEAATTFWPAEGYHQDYARLNPVRYTYYRWACGRDQRLEALWGKPAAS